MATAWVNYTCTARESDVPRIEACLEAAGAAAVSCSAAEDVALLVDELDGTHPLWPVCEVSGLFPAGTDFGLLETLFSEAAIAPLGSHIDKLPERQWQHAWREQFKPQVYGGRICICPTWCEPPDGSDIVIRLDPGMAFGTGNHATTAMCLDWLARNGTVAGARFLDYGCGSGILALAAAKLGAREVTAVDIDSEALQVCRANAAANGLDDIRVIDPARLDTQRFDIIVANILLEPLLGLAPRFAQLLVPGGHLVLSGILIEQTPTLLAAYAAPFKMTHEQHLGEWALVAGKTDPQTEGIGRQQTSESATE